MKIFVLTVLLSLQILAHAADGKKVLVLIVASDGYPVYHELQKCWRSYMHSDPEHVEAYFVKANPRLQTPVQIDGDVIWAKTSTDPSGIILKTLNTMEFFLDRIKNEFDYVIRTNLSTFYAFPRLLKFLETLPETGCYCGDNTGGDSIVGSGAGIIFSPDVIELLVSHKDQYAYRKNYVDDCLIAWFLKDKGIHLQRHYKITIDTLDDWYRYKSNFPEDMFQVRIKTNTTDDYGRLPNDIIVYSELCDMFYKQ